MFRKKVVYMLTMGMILCNITIAQKSIPVYKNPKASVELRVRDLLARIWVLLKELKAFQSVFLKKGESKKIDLSFPIKDLVLYNNKEEEAPYTGKFEMMLGNSSMYLPLKSNFIVND